MLDWPGRLATKLSSEEMAKPHLEMTGSAHTRTNTRINMQWDRGLQLPYKLMGRTLQILSFMNNYTPTYNSVYLKTD